LVRVVGPALPETARSSQNGWINSAVREALLWIYPACGLSFRLQQDKEAFAVPFLPILRGALRTAVVVREGQEHLVVVTTQRFMGRKGWDDQPALKVQ